MKSKKSQKIVLLQINLMLVIAKIIITGQVSPRAEVGKRGEVSDRILADGQEPKW